MYSKLYNRGKMVLRKRFIRYDNIRRMYTLLHVDEYGASTSKSSIHLLKENVKDPKGGKVFFTRTLLPSMEYAYEVYVTDENGKVVYSSKFKLNSQFSLLDYLEKQDAFAVVAKCSGSDTHNSQYILNAFNKDEDSTPFMSLQLDSSEAGFANQILDAVNREQDDSPVYLLLKTSQTTPASHKLIRVDGTGQKLDEPIKSAIYFYNKSGSLKVGDRVCWIQHTKGKRYVTLNVGYIGSDGNVNVLYSGDFGPYYPDSIRLKLEVGREQDIDNTIKRYIPNIDDFISKKSDNLILKDAEGNVHILSGETGRELKSISADNESYLKVLTTDNGKGIYLLRKYKDPNQVDLRRLFNYDGNVYEIPVSIPDEVIPKDKPIDNEEVDKQIETFIKNNENNNLDIAFRHNKGNKVSIVRFKGKFSDLDDGKGFKVSENSYDDILYAPIQPSKVDSVSKLFVGVDYNPKRQQLFDINGNILLQVVDGEITIDKDSLIDGEVAVQSGSEVKKYRVVKQGDKPRLVTPEGKAINNSTSEESSLEQTKSNQIFIPDLDIL